MENIREEVVQIMENLPDEKLAAVLRFLESLLKEEPSTQQGWAAFMEMGTDGLGSGLKDASIHHDKYLYQEEK